MNKHLEMKSMLCHLLKIEDGKSPWEYFQYFRLVLVTRNSDEIQDNLTILKDGGE